MDQSKKQKRVPTRDECLRLMDRYGMLDNIVDHSLTVTKVALFLSKELNKRGQQIDLAVVEAASLLHDLAKTECLKTRKDHAVAGSQLLRGLGYERIAEVVEQHIEVSGERDRTTVSEEEVVNYADKRVRHDRIVCLNERFSDLRDRYGRGRVVLGRMEQMENATIRMEHKIYAILETDPKDLLRLQDEGADRSD